jgi:prevent-host-death family protein
LTHHANGHKILVMAKSKSTRYGGRKNVSLRDVVPAADFKAQCLKLMDRVRETGVEYVITKHGEPVAKLVPYTADERTPVFGSLKGTVLKYERPFDPLDDEYDIDRQ